jgi:hypothetical protein
MGGWARIELNPMFPRSGHWIFRRLHGIQEILWKIESMLSVPQIL